MLYKDKFFRLCSALAVWAVFQLVYISNMQQALDHLKKDKVLAKIIANETLETPNRADQGHVYAELIRSLVGQQLSVKAAATIYGRLVDFFGTQSPSPTVVLGATDEDLRAVGLSRQKIGYIKNIAQYFAEKPELQNPNPEFWAQIDNETLVEMLSSIKGVGRWTVQMILMFSLQRPDVFPEDDLGIKNAMVKWYGLEGKPKEIKLKMRQKSQDWQPHRTLACRYLWASLNNAPS